ncbi:MAG: hypothetical protein OEX77_09415 [Candidatus Bathyarchaeota archaeon]|nr:hypothetical protein [Candidatus Bathyarchaeota archaeon]
MTATLEAGGAARTYTQKGSGPRSFSDLRLPVAGFVGSNPSDPTFSSKVQATLWAIVYFRRAKKLFFYSHHSVQEMGLLFHRLNFSV